MAEGRKSEASLEEITDAFKKLSFQENAGLDVAHNIVTEIVPKSRRGFGSLPTELHIAIVEDCDDYTLLSLRRVCQNLALDTNDIFAKRFFTTVYHCLIQDSMDRLSAIAHTPRIARHITTLSLDIGLKQCRKIKKRKTRVKPGDWMFVKGDHQMEDSSQLAEALRQLSALDAGSVVVAHSANSAIDLHCLTTALLRSNHALRKLRIDVNDVHIIPSSELQNLSLDDLERRRTVWSKLEVLELDLFYDEDPSAFSQVTDFIGVLNSASSLQNLTVTSYCSPGVTDLYKTLGADQLRTLELEGEVLSSADLCSVLEHYRSSLKQLSFTHITLHELHGWRTVLRKIRNDMQLEKLSVFHVDDSESGHSQRFGTYREEGFSFNLQPSAMREKLTILLKLFSR
ncbi:unnamed protein product [Cercospora beticola]|nr:unnamed protein product [Cercospora beticola]